MLVGLVFIAIFSLAIGFTLLLKLLLIQQFRAALFIKIHPQAAGRFIIGTAIVGRQDI